jgi:hypothetical protein
MASYFGPNNATSTTTVDNLNINGIVTSNLRLYLDAGRSLSFPQTGSTWNDISGNGTNVTMYNLGGTTYSANPAGSPEYTQQNGGALLFNGSTNFGKFSTIVSTSAFSVCAWVNFTNGGDMGILSHCNGGPVGESYGVSGGKMYYMYYTSSWQSATGTSSVNTGSWKNIVFAKNGTNMVMYINGVQDYTTTLTGSVTSSLASIGSKWGPCNSDSYGAGSDSYGSVFNGFMAVVMVYTKQLSAGEVSQNYNALKGRFR